VLGTTPVESLAHCNCGHLVEGHDPIASRYCRATLRGALQRGCICAAASEPDVDQFASSAGRNGVPVVSGASSCSS
jgi:hypothetical protein